MSVLLNVEQQRLAKLVSMLVDEPTAPSIDDVMATVGKHFSGLEQPVKACLATCATMALKGRTRPLTLIMEGTSGSGKTTVLQMFFSHKQHPEMNAYVYRSDKFTPKSFVSHAANVSKEELDKTDLLPRLKNKVLITKELAPLFRSRKEEMQDTFAILISVLDGQGLVTDSGMRGQRGYANSILFNWLGATTPFPIETYRMMAQLGTRFLFYEMEAKETTDEELLSFLEQGDDKKRDDECNLSVNQFLLSYFKKNGVGSIEQSSIAVSRQTNLRIIRFARLLVTGRTAITYERDESAFDGYKSIRVAQSEQPFRVVGALKDLAIGHALIHGRNEVNEDDLSLVAHVAISSIPLHLRPLLRWLSRNESLSSSECRNLLRVSPPTCRRYLEELEALGFVTLERGSPSANTQHIARLSEAFQWISEENLESEVLDVD